MHGHDCATGGIRLWSTSKLEFLTFRANSTSEFKLQLHWAEGLASHLCIILTWWLTSLFRCFGFLLAATNCFDLREPNQSVDLYPVFVGDTFLSHTQWNFTASAGVAGRWSVPEPQCKKDSRTRIHFPRLGENIFSAHETTCYLTDSLWEELEHEHNMDPDFPSWTRAVSIKTRIPPLCSNPIDDISKPLFKFYLNLVFVFLFTPSSSIYS